MAEENTTDDQALPWQEWQCGICESAWANREEAERCCGAKKRREPQPADEIRQRDHAAVIAFLEYWEKQYREGHVHSAGGSPMAERRRKDCADTLSCIRHQIARGEHLLLQMMRIEPNGE